MKYVIIGSGSIGMLLSSYLAQQTNSLLLATHRNIQANQIEQKGLHLVHTDKITKVQHVRTSSCSALLKNNLTDIETIDVMIIAVKSHQVKQVLEDLKGIEHKVASILFLQNGMGHTEMFHDISIPEVAVGVVEHGAMRTNDWTVYHTGVGRLRWSYVQAGKKVIETAFSPLRLNEFPILQEKNWIPLLHSKLIVNACVNPLTALLMVKNGQLLENKYYLNMMSQVFDEACTVLETSEKDQMWEYVRDVCQKTSSNSSSMLLDFEKKRKTEIDSILGYLLRQAANKKIHAPIIAYLHDAIKGKEVEFREGEVES
ncbi:2-dehydropantoate 2-reductase [Halalkalibacter wakoensis]|uniref:2-dehydropantoate 2-reductase n=1 Tax=Halalkalibacter wakoensis TaxID=127891 RepID=UPI000ACD5F42|nr:2-dehydropantoate 2-reductase [Halalkalibacter wakoensis]